MHTLNEKKETLIKHLQALGSVCVAYSGGVDSTLLLHLARTALGNQAEAVMAIGAFVPSYEATEALSWAKTQGIEPTTLPVDFLGNPLVSSNPTDRCYHCKHMIFSELTRHAAQRGIPHVVEGTNADDLKDYRPGLRALRTLGIRSPLLEVGLTKAEIRELSQSLGLPTWNKPALSCLASRIPSGEPIRLEVLQMVEASESLLKELGFRQYRVRVHDHTARLEVDPQDFPLVLTHRDALLWQLKALGFRHITLDLEGYRMGSMNEGR